jgi:HEAT repeat protein
MKQAKPMSRSNPRARGAVVRVAAPLAVGILLASIAVFFGIRGGRERPAPEVATAPEDLSNVLPQMPHGTPTEKDPFRWPEKSPRRDGAEFPRWDLKELPDGWDASLAHSIHDYFDAMELDHEDAEKLAAIHETRRQFQEFLDGLGPEAVPTIVAILNAEGDFVDRRFLIKALGGLGSRTEEATYALRDFFLARQVNPENRSELLHVIEAMGELKNVTSLQMLTDFARRDDLHSYRPQLVGALGDHPRREETLGTLVGIMHDDPVILARNKAAQALGKIRSEDTLGDLYQAFEKEHYWVNKQTILGTIGKIGDASSYSFLEDKARNAKEPAVRLSAGGALRRLGPSIASTALRDLARTEPDPEVRQRFERWAEDSQRK